MVEVLAVGLLKVMHFHLVFIHLTDPTLCWSTSVKRQKRCGSVNSLTSITLTHCPNPKFTNAFVLRK